MAFEHKDLISLDLEDLMNVEIKTASKKSRKISDTPAAAFVMTSEDIKRSGATNITDLLRLVPGIHVARIDANKWAVTCRGFNGRFSNKLLVMVDGRTVYSPIFSGVFWDMQDVIIEDIEKIEVVRGPGSTLWGANAVNGVINILTKNSSKTIGTRIDAGAGTEDKFQAYASYGGEVRKGITYRLSAKHADRDRGWSTDNVDDSSDSSRGGVRMDMEREGLKAFIIAEAADNNTSESDLSLEPSYYLPQMSALRFQDVLPGGINSGYSLYGQYALAKIEKEISGTSDLSFQTYFDRAVRNSKMTKLEQKTTDFDLQFRMQAPYRNEIITGCGARFTDDSFRTENQFYGINPAKDSYSLFNFFLQDEYEAIEDFLSLTAGTKIEKNDFSGYEFQPSARIMMNPGRAVSLWCSVSKAVRTPSRGEETGFVMLRAPLPGIPDLSLKSEPRLLSEKVLAWEAGIRYGISSSQSIDAAFFFNDYYDLRTLEMSDLFEFTLRNKMKGHSKGAEIFYEIGVMPAWRISAGYSYLLMDIRKTGDDFLNISGITENSNPMHKLELRSSSDLSSCFRLDLYLRFVDEVRSYDIPSYCSLDANLAWQITPDLELSITGRDLLDESHPEYPPEILQTLSTEIERSFFFKLAWKN